MYFYDRYLAGENLQDKPQKGESFLTYKEIHFKEEPSYFAQVLVRWYPVSPRQNSLSIFWRILHQCPFVVHLYIYINKNG